MNIKQLLDKEAADKNKTAALMVAADPLRVAKLYKDDISALVCALFAYGNAKLIEKFLLSLDFSALEDENTAEEKLAGRYYRFQTNRDVVEFFKTLARLKKKLSLENVFFEGYATDKNVINGLKEVISAIYDINPYRSVGYEFLIGKIPDKKNSSPYKRWNMFLRWMARDDELDMGLWKKVDKADLLIPLDVHTFNVSKKLGLLKRKSYDFKAVLELSETLKSFDPSDPIKYDFALYRIGQSKTIDNFLIDK